MSSIQYTQFDIDDETIVTDESIHTKGIITKGVYVIGSIVFCILIYIICIILIIRFSPYNKM